MFPRVPPNVGLARTIDIALCRWAVAVKESVFPGQLAQFLFVQAHVGPGVAQAPCNLGIGILDSFVCQLAADCKIPVQFGVGFRQLVDGGDTVVTVDFVFEIGFAGDGLPEKGQVPGFVGVAARGHGFHGKVHGTLVLVADGIAAFFVHYVPVAFLGDIGGKGDPGLRVEGHDGTLEDFKGSSRQVPLAFLGAILVAAEVGAYEIRRLGHDAGKTVAMDLPEIEHGLLAFFCGGRTLGDRDEAVGFGEVVVLHKRLLWLGVCFCRQKKDHLVHPNGLIMSATV